MDLEEKNQCDGLSILSKLNINFKDPSEYTIFQDFATGLTRPLILRPMEYEDKPWTSSGLGTKFEDEANVILHNPKITQLGGCVSVDAFKMTKLLFGLYLCETCPTPIYVTDIDIASDKDEWKNQFLVFHNLVLDWTLGHHLILTRKFPRERSYWKYMSYVNSLDLSKLENRLLKALCHAEWLLESAETTASIQDWKLRSTVEVLLSEFIAYLGGSVNCYYNKILSSLDSSFSVNLVIIASGQSNPTEAIFFLQDRKEAEEVLSNDEQSDYQFWVRGSSECTKE